MFRYFSLVKNHEITNNSTTTEAREKNNTDLKILKFQNIFDVHSIIFLNNQILLNKISHRYVMAAKLYTG